MAALNANASLPYDREIWIVTDQGDAHQVQYSSDAEYWTGREEWGRTDGESGTWDRTEIIGWSDDHATADRHAQAIAADIAFEEGLIKEGMSPVDAAEYVALHSATRAA